MSEADTPQEEANKYQPPSELLKDEAGRMKDEQRNDEGSGMNAETDSPIPPSSVDLEPSEFPAQEEPRVQKVVSLVHTPPTSQEDTTAPSMKSQPPIDTPNLFLLAAELRQRNRDLLVRVNHLEKAYAECQEALQAQKVRSQSQETLLAQASEQLKASQEQVTRLFRELESSHQAAQRQQILIETLTQQLENSQERIAQLERECAFTQQRYNEQSHQLFQSENHARELSARLHRQQRQTLQFKAALEKCLEMPAPKAADPEPDIPGANWAQRQPKNAPDPSSLVPKAQPIQPWSVRSHFLDHQANIEEESNPGSSSYSPITDTTAFVSADWEPIEEEMSNSEEELRVVEEQDIASVLDDYPLPTEVDYIYSISDPETVSHQEISAIEEEIEDLLLAVTSVPEENDEPETIDTAASDYRFPFSSFLEDTSEDDADLNAAQEEATPREEEFAASSPAQRSDAILSQPNWPSPIVYPQRPPKGRKTLASIELPTFPKRK
ncbi:hypothetical protein NDI37_24585 [Funiculus sociatus GB2-A5]|uniref:Uncharacterized protein n=1 Tax=Funiculus sociatus GB2-A5 TaxID=2933946 RepID=A0ABV0JVY7_9CYAN|nr:MULTISPECIES: hypothetical protein [unclassified Trichocoleus]MBD1907154.1 hypothetical protein [Trichocoleus sp. FACHB-832]MBD2062175.1 hypothetical protein [Trichocoleus sp. FACHB-6]